MQKPKEKSKGLGPRETALREMREKRADDLRSKIKPKVIARVKKKVENIKSKRRGRRG